jgi:hypothetical protein
MVSQQKTENIKYRKCKMLPHTYWRKFSFSQ